jgi:hypothetical protein
LQPRLQQLKKSCHCSRSQDSVSLQGMKLCLQEFLL